MKASVIQTTSVSGLAGNFGQANYASAKLGLVALSRVASLEGRRYGVRSNAVSPGARTRLTLGIEDEPAAETSGFDHMDPANVSPLISWLAEADCPADSQVFHITGDTVVVSSLPPILHKLTNPDGRWTEQRLAQELTPRLVTPTGIADWFGVPVAELPQPATR